MSTYQVKALFLLGLIWFIAMICAVISLRNSRAEKISIGLAMACVFLTLGVLNL